MNDVELRYVPALSWCASVQTFRLGIYCVQQKHNKPSQHARLHSSTVTASSTAWKAYLGMLQKGLLRGAPCYEDV